MTMCAGAGTLWRGCDLDDVVGLPHQCRERAVNGGGIQDHERFASDFFEHSRNLRQHILCPIKECRIVLKKDDRVARLFQYGEELVSSECPADLKIFG